jgi:hypothetical protein
VGPSLLPLLGSPSFLTIFSLSPPVLLCFSLLLSAITEPVHRSLPLPDPHKKNIIHISVKIQKTQQNPTQHHHTQITDQDLLGISREIRPPAWLFRPEGDRTTGLAFERDGLFEVFFSLDCEIKVWVLDPFDSGVDERADLVETVWELGGV